MKNDETSRRPTRQRRRKTRTNKDEGRWEGTRGREKRKKEEVSGRELVG